RVRQLRRVHFRTSADRERLSVLFEQLRGRLHLSQDFGRSGSGQRRITVDVIGGQRNSSLMPRKSDGAWPSSPSTVWTISVYRGTRGVATAGGLPARCTHRSASGRSDSSERVAGSYGPPIGRLYTFTSGKSNSRDR